jgi:hypothetical protein
MRAAMLIRFRQNHPELSRLKTGISVQIDESKPNTDCL